MIKKEPVKKTFGDILREHGAVFSICLSDGGYANVDLNHDGKKWVVTFLNDDGCNREDEIPMEDVEKVARFVQQLRDMRLPDFKTDLVK
ncbi:MAG TPA: hypothetical protein PLI01_00490 [Nitrospira sp.]|nr:hypothetical protein [Nitrospira sp.]HNA25237.1 hypothetical protein [Nitrospira sp.]HNI17527.1 hypothetical protein [Nitrospira sp.]